MEKKYKIALLIIFTSLLAINVLSTVSAKTPTNADVEISDGTRGQTSKLSVKITDNKGNPVSGIVHIKSYYPDGKTYQDIVENSDSNGYYERKINWDSKQILGKYKFDINIQPHQGNIYETCKVSKTFNLAEKTTMSVSASKNPVDRKHLSSIKVRLSCGDQGRNNFEWLGHRLILFYHDNNIYQAYTDLNGIAIFNFKSLVSGVHNIKIIHGGDDKFIGVQKSIDIKVKPGADLLITHIKKYKNNYYKVLVKNEGDLRSKTAILTLMYKKNKFNKVKVGPINPNKGKVVLVKFYPYNQHKKYKKIAYINHGKHAVEYDYSNNKVLFKTADYIRYKADLRTVKAIRSGKYYKITIKNLGNKAATKFKVKFWYGTQTKAKETLSFTMSKFGTFGKSLPPSKSVTVTLPVFKSSKQLKSYKYISLNYNKYLLESNYKNNIGKFK